MESKCISKFHCRLSFIYHRWRVDFSNLCESLGKAFFVHLVLNDTIWISIRNQSQGRIFLGFILLFFLLPFPQELFICVSSCSGTKGMLIRYDGDIDQCKSLLFLVLQCMHLKHKKENWIILKKNFRRNSTPSLMVNKVLGNKDKIWYAQI